MIKEPPQFKTSLRACNAPSGGRFDGPFSSALDTLSCLVLHSFGISVGVRVASCCRVFFL